VRADLAGRLQAQMQRVELVLDDAVSCVQTITNTMQGGVIRPLREVGGILAGVRTAVRVFLHFQRPSVDQRRRRRGLPRLMAALERGAGIRSRDARRAS